MLSRNLILRHIRYAATYIAFHYYHISTNARNMKSSFSRAIPTMKPFQISHLCIQHDSICPFIINQLDYPAVRIWGI